MHILALATTLEHAAPANHAEFEHALSVLIFVLAGCCGLFTTCFVLVRYGTAIAAVFKGALGANWRTTLSGVGMHLGIFLSLLSGLSYQMGPIADVIPPDWKAFIFKVSAVSGVLFGILNSCMQKDRNVTGGNVQQTATGNVAADQEPTPAPPNPALPK